MNRKKSLWLVTTTAALLLVLIASASAQGQDLSDMELLGEFLYFDENLSQPGGQS